MVVLKRWLQSISANFRGINHWYVFAILALVPVFFSPTLAMQNKVQDTLFVIDISESMNVPDVETSIGRIARLELAKRATKEAMASLNCGSKVSLGLFAGEQVVVLFEPLEVCRHYSSIEQVVSNISTHMRWIGDSIIENGLINAINESITRQLNLVFITDGDEMPHKSSPRVTQLEKLRGKVNGGNFLVGQPVPAPVPKVDGVGEVVGYWAQEDAAKEGYHPNLIALVNNLAPGESAPENSLIEVQEHMSAARPEYLKILSTGAGLHYQELKSPNGIALFVASNLITKEKEAETDIRWWFAITSALLILLGWFSNPDNLLPFLNRRSS
jgi:mxaL protein